MNKNMIFYVTNYNNGLGKKNALLFSRAATYIEHLNE